MRLDKLDPPVDLDRDHVLGPPDAEMTLVEYGSYACRHCHAVHEVIEGLRSRFGERMRYVFRHLPVAGSEDAIRAAELAEYAAETTGRFWEVHEALMERGPAFAEGDFERIAREFNLPPSGAAHEPALAAAQARVRRGRRERTAQRCAGNADLLHQRPPLCGRLGRKLAGRRDARLAGPSDPVRRVRVRSLGTIVGTAPGARDGARAGAQQLARWAGVPVLVGNAHWDFIGARPTSRLTLLDWVNHGLLTIFFFVVGLEIKREFTVGHLATFRSGALPVIAAFGGIVLPAVIYASIAPPDLRHGWGIPIGTDTAFAVALIVLLGDRVPVELRVFLTAAVIIDDIVAIVVIALFYTGEIAHDLSDRRRRGDRAAGGAQPVGVYGALPYAVCGIVLWFFLHEAGLHATLAGVILAVLIPTRPPANLNALLAQAATVIHLEDRHTGEAMRPGPSEPALRALDAIHARIESPADKLLRIRRAVVELRGAADLRAGERWRRLVGRRVPGTRTIDGRDHVGTGRREVDRHRGGRVARGAERHRGETRRLLVASVDAAPGRWAALVSRCRCSSRGWRSRTRPTMPPPKSQSSSPR